MDKLIQLCTQSIIQLVAGNTVSAKQYEELAMDEYMDINGIARVEDYVPRQIKKKLYEMVS